MAEEIGEYPPERLGWENKVIELACDQPIKIHAAVYGDFAVHQMLGSDGEIDVGWATTYAPKGWRMSSRYRVFKTAEGAQKLIEKVTPLWNNWADFFDTNMPQRVRDVWNNSHDQAELNGDIIKNYVIVPAKTMTN